MIQLVPQMRIFVGIDPIDFRCGIDKLCIISESQMNVSAHCGVVFVFRNKQKTAVKILVHDGVGFWLIQRRLSQARLSWWPSDPEESLKIDAHALAVILQGERPSLERKAMWKRIDSGSGESKKRQEED